MPALGGPFGLAWWRREANVRSAIGCPFGLAWRRREVQGNLGSPGQQQQRRRLARLTRAPLGARGENLDFPKCQEQSSGRPPG